MLTRASQRLLLAGAALAASAGAQEFGPAQVAGSLQGVTPLEVADLDGDGLLDLLVSTPNLFTVRWHRGLGSGTFAGAQSVMGARSSRLALADFDVDGDLDVFALDLDRIRLAENLGGGSFALPLDVVQTPFQVLDVAVGDLDGDGDGDLALSWFDYAGAAEVQVVTNLGSSGWSAPSTLSTAPVIQRFVSLEDLDADGDLDLLALSISPSELQWWSQVGGALVQQPTIQLQGSVPLDVEVGDLDGDGVPDLVAPAFNSQTVSWHRGIGGGSFAAPELLASMVGPFDDVALADLDGDGRLDVVGTGFVDAACSWFPGTGGGALGPARSVTAGLPGGVGRTVATGDLDGDGDLVVALTDAGTGELRWYANLAAGTDCDGDGVPDSQQLAAGTDCDGNGLLDVCDLVDPRNDWNGDGLLDACSSIAYCTSAPNSTGQVGTITPLGTPDQTALILGLRAEGLPSGQWCHFLLSQNTANLPGFSGSQGTLCVGAPIVRLNRPAYGEIGQTSPAGTFEVSIEVFDLPQGVTIGQGSTWHFQLWYRDLNPGTTSNTSSAVRVMFR